MPEFPQLLAALSSISKEESLYEDLSRHRNRSPILVAIPPNQSVSIFLDYQNVREALCLGERYSSAIKNPMYKLLIGSASLTSVDGPSHQLERKWTTNVLRIFRGRDWTSRFVTAADESLTGFAASEVFGSADLVSGFTRHFPALCLSRVLGIPEPIRGPFHLHALNVLDLDQDVKAGVRSLGWITRTLDRLIRSPGSSMRGALLDAIRSGIDHHEYSEDQGISFIKLLLPAALETTYRSLGNTLVYILTSDRAREMALGSERSLAALIDEVIRLESPLQAAPRQLTERTEVNGRRLLRGSTVLLHLGAANRDPSIFADPDALNGERRQRHLGFGFGPHACLGADIVRNELRVAIRVLFNRYPQIHLCRRKTVRPSDMIRGIITRSPRSIPVRLA